MLVRSNRTHQPLWLGNLNYTRLLTATNKPSAGRLNLAPKLMQSGFISKRKVSMYTAMMVIGGIILGFVIGAIVIGRMAGKVLNEILWGVLRTWK